MEDEGIAQNRYMFRSIWAESRACTLYWNILYMARISAHTNWISCMYLAQFPRLPFSGLIYIQLRHLCLNLKAISSKLRPQKIKEK